MGFRVLSLNSCAMCFLAPPHIHPALFYLSMLVFTRIHVPIFTCEFKCQNCYVIILSTNELNAIQSTIILKAPLRNNIDFDVNFSVKLFFNTSPVANPHHIFATDTELHYYISFFYSFSRFRPNEHMKWKFIQRVLLLTQQMHFQLSLLCTFKIRYNVTYALNTHNTYTCT